MRLTNTRTVLYLASLVSLGFCIAAQSRPRHTPPEDVSSRLHNVAILAGIANYPSQSGWNPLHYAENDVEDVASVLQKQGYTVFPLSGGNATGNAIRDAIKASVKILDPKRGTLIFFFSGHGFADTKSEMNFLAPFDSRVAHGPDHIEDGLPLADVERLMKETGAQHRIVWLDACRNDPTEGDAKGFNVIAPRMSRLTAARGSLVLYASSAGKQSWEYPELKHGVFTFFLLRAMDGNAAGPDGLLTFRDIASYVLDQVKSYSIPKRKEQIPAWFGESDLDFVVGKAVGGIQQLVSQPAGPERHGSAAEARDAPVSNAVDINTRLERLQLWAKQLDQKYEAENEYDRKKFGLSARTPSGLIGATAELSSAERDVKANKEQSAGEHLDEAEKLLQHAQAEFGAPSPN